MLVARHFLAHRAQTAKANLVRNLPIKWYLLYSALHLLNTSKVKYNIII